MVDGNALPVEPRISQLPPRLRHVTVLDDPMPQETVFRYALDEVGRVNVPQEKSIALTGFGHAT